MYSHIGKQAACCTTDRQVDQAYEHLCSSSIPRKTSVEEAKSRFDDRTATFAKSWRYDDGRRAEGSTDCCR
jgi:hypothetical protein